MGNPPKSPLTSRIAMSVGSSFGGCRRKSGRHGLITDDNKMNEDCRDDGGGDIKDCGEESGGEKRTLWIDQEDATDTGVDIDPDYIGGDADDASKPGYSVGPEIVTDGGMPLDMRSDALATDAEQEKDGDRRRNDWYDRGVQRTTFKVDGKDAHGGELPQRDPAGRDLGALRRRMWELNTGVYSRDRSRVGRVDREYQETRQIVEAVATQCGLRGRQVERAVQHAVDMDGRRWRPGGRILMALGAVVRAVAENTDEPAEHPAVKSDTFERVAQKSCGVSTEHVLKKANAA